jgi:hypothetical protein
MWVEVNERFTQMATGSTNTGQDSDDTLRIERDLLLAKAAAEEGRTIVLVEGLSDKAAIDALAKRHGRNLADEGITIVAIGGATKIWGFLDSLGPLDLGVKLAGLCDIGEERHFRRALQRAGFGLDITRSDMERLGFYICNADLEDELIRSLGANTMLEVIAEQGDLGRFHLFRRQPEWQEQSRHAQLRRWLGTTAHRKISYARLLVDALDLGRVPEPLERLLAHIASLHKWGLRE